MGDDGVAPMDGRSARLEAQIRGSGWLMEVLDVVRESGLPDAWVGAGVFRDLVWDGLHAGFDPAGVRDVDVAFFDASDLRPEPAAGCRGARPSRSRSGHS